MPEPTIPSGDPAQPNATPNGDVAGNAGAGDPAQPSSPDVAAGDPNAVKTQADQSGLPDKLATMGNENAKYRKAISAMGMSPDDDTIQQLADGVVTPEDLRARFGPQTPAQQHNAPEPDQSPFARMQAVVAKTDSGQPVTEDDFKTYIKADLEHKTNQAHAAQANASKQVFTDCKAAAISVLEADPTYQAQPDKIKAIEKKLFWAAVDVAVGDGVPPGVDPSRFLNGNTYSHYAQQVLVNDMAALRGHYSGKPSVPTPGPGGINPLGAADGGATIETPRAALNFGKVKVGDAMTRYFKESSPAAV